MIILSRTRNGANKQHFVPLLSAFHCSVSRTSGPVAKIYENENFFNLHSEQIELIIRVFIIFSVTVFGIQEWKIKVGSCRDEWKKINCIFQSKNCCNYFWFLIKHYVSWIHKPSFVYKDVCESVWMDIKWLGQSLKL